VLNYLKKHLGGKVPTADVADVGRSPKTLLGGAYRLHDSNDVVRFTGFATDAFPDFAKRVTCFGADWLGNQFATDEARIVDGDRQILLLEIGTGEVLEIPAGLSTFHDGLLVQEPDAAVALGFFGDWLSVGGAAPRYDQCVGYKVPLYLGGADNVSNLEVSDFEVYWGLSAQLLAKARALPKGTAIGNVTIGD